MTSVECTHSTTVVLDAKEATCTEKGSTGEVVCVDCGTVVQEAQEIAAKGHTFGEWVTVKEPTTTEEGSKEEPALYARQKRQRPSQNFRIKKTRISRQHRQHRKM